MTPRNQVILAAVAGGLFVLASTTLYVVREDQQALVLQFGAPVGGPINAPGADEAGLKIKAPIHNVVYFDRRNLEFDLSNSIEIIVSNEQRLLVDAFVRYQITDPLLYYQSLGAAGASAQLMRSQFDSRMTNVLGEAMRQTLGAVEIPDIITRRRVELMREIRTDVTEEARKLGVTVIDVRIRQADFPEQNANEVYQRMSSDYKQQAELTRAEGNRRARERRAEADKEVVQIRAVASQEAEIIRGKADATRNCIFAGAYQGIPVRVVSALAATDAPVAAVPAEPAALAAGAADPAIDPAAPAADGTTLATPVGATVGDAAADVATVPTPPAPAAAPTPGDGAPAATATSGGLEVSCRYLSAAGGGDPTRAEFFAFYRSLTAYQSALGNPETTMILSPDSDFFRYFNDQGSRR